MASATITVTESVLAPAAAAAASSSSGAPQIITLRLRRRKPKKLLGWGTGIPDNEHMGRKSSKKCCVFHKPKRWNESDTESDEEKSRPRREFNRHVHPPGWDASECGQCEVERRRELEECTCHHEHDHDHEHDDDDDDDCSDCSDDGSSHAKPPSQGDAIRSGGGGGTDGGRSGGGSVSASSSTAASVATASTTATAPAVSFAIDRKGAAVE